ncbi:MAG: hypothetical protein NPIRA06_14420 [Nitrospirales bacterium]|nr:MAG: hypothetical protein NPIRA06_14420 [Nitrospirales bacterium]
MNLSQPALSVQLRSLENTLGEKLIHRVGRSLPDPMQVVCGEGYLERLLGGVPLDALDIVLADTVFHFTV